MKLISITNKNTKGEVCGYYLNREIDLNKCKMAIGEPLLIVYTGGTHFQHEDVEKIDVRENTLTIETIRKIWIIEWGASYDNVSILKKCCGSI